MKRFTEYLREQGLGMDDIFSKGPTPLGNLGITQDADSVMKVVQMAVESHYDEVVEFLHALGRKDPHIQDALDDMNRYALNQPGNKKPSTSLGKGMDRDEVVPAQADKASGGGVEPN